MSKRMMVDGRAVVRAYKRDPLRIPRRMSEATIDALEAIDAVIDALDVLDIDDMTSPAVYAFDGEDPHAGR